MKRLSLDVLVWRFANNQIWMANMITQKKWFVTLILAASLFELVSCTTTIDNDLMGHEGCAPPCWMGIKPGVTTKSTGIQLLEELEAKGEGKLAILPTSLEWQKNNRLYYLFFDEDIITVIKVRIRATTVDEIISLFGEPSQFLVGDIIHGSYTLTLLYPDKGIAVISGGSDGFRIDPNMHVGYAYFMQPTDLKSMLGLLYGNKFAETALSAAQNWKGYGEISP
jgi:hypothetical protein